MSDETSTKPKAPYLPYSSFRKFISGFKSGVPSRIDKSLMNGHSGSMQSWILSALKFFDLTDGEGRPTEALEKLAQGDDETQKAVWNEHFIRAYAPIINGLDLKRATLGQLYERFGEEFSVDTKKKCQSFFSAGADDAGIELAPQLKPNSRGTGPRRPRKPRVATKLEGNGDAPDVAPHGGSGKGTTATLLLDVEGARKISLHGPASITPAELDRLKNWVAVQFIIDDSRK